MSRYRQLIGRLKKQLGTVSQQDEQPEYTLPFEDLVRTGVAEVLERTETLRIPWNVRLRAFLHQRGLHSAYDTVLREELRLIVTRVTYRVETLTEPGTGKTVRADMSEVGPSRSKLTWSGLTLLARLAVEYAMPLERLSKMFGSFSDSQLFRWLYQLASALLPVYLYLAEVLAEANYLLGDDSPTKVLGMQKQAEQRRFGVERDQDLDPLIQKAAAQLGRINMRKDGKGALKTKLQVSFICGKEIVSDPKSYIFFFRTHFGSCGNLLSTLLSMRRRKNKNLTVQGDLSTTNFAQDLYYQLFDIRHIGCGGHARRDVWRYREQDEEVLGYILRGFALLSHVERLIDQKGRAQERILRYRNKYARRIWQLIYEKAKSVTEHKSANHWPKSSKVFGACRYITRHYELGELTAYLTDAHAFFTNNLCERQLRAEKMLLVACKFRSTERGRVVFDILRTILMTAAAAKINVAEYFKFVMLHQEEVQENPAAFTPYAFAKKVDAERKKAEAA